MAETSVTYAEVWLLGDELDVHRLGAALLLGRGYRLVTTRKTAAHCRVSP